MSGGGVGPATTSMSSIVGSKKHNKLTNRYEQEVQVAFPLQPLGKPADDGEEEGQEWLSEEDYQAYSVRVRTRLSTKRLNQRLSRSTHRPIDRHTPPY